MRPESRTAPPPALAEAGIRCVVVVGGSGRLGSAFVRALAACGCRVHVVDAHPPDVLPHVRFTPVDLTAQAALPATAFARADAVVHLAALHGAHLAAGVPRRRFWNVNVRGTAKVLDAAVKAGVRKVVFASSTSVYGSGSPPGQPARVLDETTPLDPEDIYDLTKVASERLIQQASTDLDTAILRFGRFFFESQESYHMRKLSTGLDVHDACKAITLALTADTPPKRTYCIASDLPMTLPQRRRLGLELPQVLDEILPGFCHKASMRSIKIPDRVGKSVDTSAARSDLGYQPERSLDWLVQRWEEKGSNVARPNAHHAALSNKE